MSEVSQKEYFEKKFRMNIIWILQTIIGRLK